MPVWTSSDDTEVVSSEEENGSTNSFERINFSNFSSERSSQQICFKR